MAKVKFVDTTLRDGHQCLWATRMSTAMMRPIMEPMDRIGFEAIEIMGAVHFDACVRYLKDDPWERIRLFRRQLRGPLQVITRSRCALGFELQPLDYRLHVGHLGLDAVVVGLAVGEPGAAAVVADEAGERAQPLVPDAELGVAPLHLPWPQGPRQM